MPTTAASAAPAANQEIRETVRRRAGHAPASWQASGQRASSATGLDSVAISELWVESHAELDAQAHDQEALHLAIDALVAALRPTWPAAKTAPVAFVRQYPEPASRRALLNRAVSIILGRADAQLRASLADPLTTAHERLVLGEPGT